eukprot:comp16669_c0_seq1/m.14899 comp16669_c0_seq1/g.14899  ORF comp16669_c0_seq1/g.14899 comp16669_c0_seq1/m.14899 type:complete len:218 (-) comp16669_c0_seq1:427-1080(-)
MRNTKPKNKGKGSKLIINFDENARADYLTGFRKRRLERQQVASKNAEEKVKEEKRRKRAELKAKLKELRELTGADFSAAGIEDEKEEGKEEAVDGEVQQYANEETVTTVVTTVVKPIALGEEEEEEESDDEKVGLDKEELERQTKIQNAKEAIRNIKQNISLLPGKPQTSKQKKGNSGHHKRQGPWKQAQKGKKIGSRCKEQQEAGGYADGEKGTTR